MRGSATSSLEALDGAMAGGKTSGTGLGTTPKETANMNTDADGAESRSDAAQQLSASACVTPLSELDSGESDLCIGHAAPSAQQAMRASGVVIQPAHSATWLAERAKLRRSADKRLPVVSTLPKDAGRS